MKATINHTSLLKELKKMSLVIRKNHIIPITSSVLLTFSKDSLTINGTDLETTIISVMPCACNDSFSVVVLYSEILDACNNAVAPLLLEVKKEKLLIISGKAKSSFTIASQPEHFPVVPKDSFDLSVIVDGDLFYNLSKANLCKYPDDSMLSLNMAAIDFKKDSIVTIGCDVNVLFKKEIPAKCSGQKLVMVPDNFVQLCKGFQETSISVGEKYIKAESDNNTVISLLSVQKYANYESILPKDVEYNIVVNKEEFKLAIKSNSITTNAISKQVLINFFPNSIKVTSQDSDLGKTGEYEIDVENRVPFEKICLNLKWLTNVLNVISGEEIELSFTAHDKTVYMRPIGDTTELCLIQPLFNF